MTEPGDAVTMGIRGNPGLVSISFVKAGRLRILSLINAAACLTLIVARQTFTLRKMVQIGSVINHLHRIGERAFSGSRHQRSHL